MTGNEEKPDGNKTFFGGVMMGVGFTIFIAIIVILVISAAPDIGGEPILQISAHQELDNVVLLENTGDYIPELATLVLEYDGFNTTLNLYHPGDRVYLYLQDEPGKRTVVIRAIDREGRTGTVMNHTFWRDNTGEVWMPPRIERMEIEVCNDPIFGRLAMSDCIKPYT